jgi:hypothetical protein
MRYSKANKISLQSICNNVSTLQIYNRTIIGQYIQCAKSCVLVDVEPTDSIQDIWVLRSVVPNDAVEANTNVLHVNQLLEIRVVKGIPQCVLGTPLHKSEQE